MSNYKINERTKFSIEFQRLFPDIKLIELFDTYSSVKTGYITIDILVLNNRIENKYPQECVSMSIKEIITKHYGVAAMELIESVL